MLLGQRPPKFADIKPIVPLDAGLNRSQIDAIELALAAADVAIIHGPPGTGKTTTVVELIRQAIARGEKVLACAPSNLAVDNLLERLVRAGERAVRLGHPARVLVSKTEHGSVTEKALPKEFFESAEYRRIVELGKTLAGLIGEGAYVTRGE